MAAVAILNFLNSLIEYARIPFSCTRFEFADLVRHFVVQLIFLAQMFFGTITKYLFYDPIRITKFKMAAAAILDQLNSGVKSVFACPMLAFVPDNMLSSSS